MRSEVGEEGRREGEEIKVKGARVGSSRWGWWDLGRGAVLGVLGWEMWVGLPICG